MVAITSFLILFCFLCLLMKEELSDKCQFQLLILLVFVSRFCFVHSINVGEKGKITLCRSSKNLKFQLPSSIYFLKSENMANILFLSNISSIQEDLQLDYCQTLTWVTGVNFLDKFNMNCFPIVVKVKQWTYPFLIEASNKLERKWPLEAICFSPLLKAGLTSKFFRGLFT